MNNRKVITTPFIKLFLCSILVIILHSCVPTRTVRDENKALPEAYDVLKKTDTITSAAIKWNEFFADPNLTSLIDQALSNNQELNILLQQVSIAQNEVQTRKGEYLPSVDLRAGAEIEKVGEFTRKGAVEQNLNIREDSAFPDPLGNFEVGAFASWEIDVWKKLRNSKKAAMMEYLASIEGRNFMVTNIVSEIANSYYELLALDYQLNILDQNIDIQNNALRIVKLQKEAARATSLAVKRFEAEVFKNKSERYALKQEIVEVENKINFLIGKTPAPITRSTTAFTETVVDTIFTGIPAQLLQYRPDIRQAELELAAAKLDVKVARANFYPSIGVKAGVGLQAFQPKFLVSTPESLLYNLTGDLVAPLINRNGIKAAYNTANDRQLQAVFEYEKTILSAYIEVANELSNIESLQQNYQFKANQVAVLNESIEISNKLFQSARADYLEILLTQRDALEAKINLADTKKEQLIARVGIYRALGGGWQ